MTTIDRTYRVRGKQVFLKELTDLMAVRSPPKDRRAALPGAALQAIAPEAAPQVRAFENAGWEFIPRQQDIDGAKVYLKPAGRIALGTNRLTVRLGDHWSDAEAKGLLVRHGFTIVDQLKFARNLFLVEVPAGQDAFEAADKLAASGEVEFAEPELIEVLPGR